MPNYFMNEAVHSEIEYALGATQSDDFTTADFPSVVTTPFHLTDIASVVDVDIDSTEGHWTPEKEYIGSELDMIAIGTLLDGRWFALTAGNDYTGWGCAGDTCSVKIADSWPKLWVDGLTDSERARLSILVLPRSIEGSES